MMEYLYFLSEVSVDSSNNHTKAIKFVKLLENFVQGLRFFFSMLSL